MLRNGNGVLTNSATCTTSDAFAECSVNCPHRCESKCIYAGGSFPSRVWYNNQVTKTTCENANGNWLANENTCIYSSFSGSKTNCLNASPSNVFDDCSGLDINQCIDCAWNDTSCIVNQKITQCYVKCTNKIDCENAGICYDTEILVNWNDGTNKKPVYGACIFPQIPNLNNISTCKWPLKIFR